MRIGHIDAIEILPYQRVFHRVHAECVDAPHVALTAEQVERLCGVSRSLCQQVLDDLVRAGVLHAGGDGQYISRRQPNRRAPVTSAVAGLSRHQPSSR